MSPLAAILFDRDGTLVHDVPYNGDPALVRPIDGAREAVVRVRAAGLRTGVVSNQSGIARGRLTREQVLAVNARVDELLGAFDTWQFCPHGPDDGCDCRKPQPGLVIRAATALGVTPADCAVIGDIGADLGAAASAGARGILVPTAATLPAEVAAATAAGAAAPTLDAALDLLGVAGGVAVTRILAVRLDSDGDVLLTGPAVRALAASCDQLDLLVSPAGRAAAELLPGVADVLVLAAPWSGFDPPPVDAGALAALVADLRARRYDRAVVFTSFHQSPLPMALLAKAAGIAWVAADSVDYPGSLLDLRHHRTPDAAGRDRHEADAALDLALAAGGRLPAGDAGLLAVRGPLPALPTGVPGSRFVVVHPGASVPARAPRPADAAAYVAALDRAGWPVVVTGGPAETALTRRVAGRSALDLGGATTLAELAAVLAAATCVVVGNTGPAHLAAAVGTPVVSLFAPVVPARRWAPHGVPVALLGDQQAPCRDSRARECPVPGHPCLAAIGPEDVVAAVRDLAPAVELLAS